MHTHSFDSRDPFSKLLAQSQTPKGNSNGLAQSNGFANGSHRLTPINVTQNGSQSIAQSSPSGAMAELKVNGNHTANGNSSLPQPFILPSQPATSLSRLPWDRTGIPHSTIITAQASLGRETFKPRFPYEKVQAKMDTIKLKHRSSLKLPDWQRYGYINDFSQLRAEAFASMPRQSTSHLLADGRASSPYTPLAATEKPAISYSIERIHWKELSLEEFRNRYEIPKIPVIIQGLTDEWEMKNWDLRQMGSETGSFRNVPMKAGEDDNGYSTKIKLKYFIDYMYRNRDDSPLYVFDSSFDEDSVGKSMLESFDVPFYFRDDLFSLVGEARRPPYRWFLVGPERSGSNLHIDPLATSAWNTLLSGVKRWVLFPPVRQLSIQSTKLRFIA